MLGPMRRNSKDGSAFGRQARDEEYEAAFATHADEIEKILAWANGVAQSAQIPMHLSASLLDT